MSDDSIGSVVLPARTAELRALEVAEQLEANRILCTTLGRAQAALELGRLRPEAEIAIWFIDEHPYRLAIDYCVKTMHEQGAVAKVAQNAASEPFCLATQIDRRTFHCRPDLPEGEFDLAVVPLSVGGESELARDLLQTARMRLAMNGWLVASVDHPRDRWLHDLLKESYEKVSVRSFEDAVVYVAQKKSELKKVKDYRCEFVFRDSENIITAMSRPGVFSHRHIDPGARQLLEAVQVGPKTRVIDIGCGCGTVGLAIAQRDPSISVHLVDSNARAVACAAEVAQKQKIENVTFELNSSGNYQYSGSFQLAFANPPYFADFRIAQLFLDAAQNALVKGGRLILVTKQPAWYEETMPEKWNDFEAWPSKRYFLVTATK